MILLMVLAATVVPAQGIGKTSRINPVAAVDKLVLHLRTRVVVDDGTTHGELIEVVVGEMSNDLLHCYRCLFACKYTAFAWEISEKHLQTCKFFCNFVSKTAVI